ncbi:DUF6398 domain-containing protein [Desulforhabdus sp. TSK]|uniref:DUF6398 domain-containing protein n=1 Tax=Desulforhabdus sp. TSK TaxID=2925014 RepID=UPI001FC863B0|nr:DUF6398 domain-containing protein [Desulforhabdus sp. TSK]GKT10808.1 hypothetical protein DSTSK_41130 [Desulforhabdus sp. TSK]
MPRVSKSEKVPEQMRPIFDAVVSLTDEVCKKHLNEEYATLARQAAAAFCRKRPSPLSHGKANSWACGIVYALGAVNFLFDKSQDPHMNATDLCNAFGLSASTGAAKSKVVRDVLKMTQFDPNWCLPSKLDSNPVAWLITVNGFMVDARAMPLAIQEEAYRKGLIPYIPERE